MLYSSIITLVISLTVLAAPAYANSGADDEGTIVSDTAIGDADTATTSDTTTAESASVAIVSDSTAVADSLRKHLKAERTAPYDATRQNGVDRSGQRTLGRGDMYRSDGSSISESMRYRALTSVYVPFTPSSVMNRSLHYGNTAHGWQPVSNAAPALRFSYTPYSLHGSDMLSVSQASDIMFDPLDGFLYTPYPDMHKHPELHILWENGAFNQNTLALRISRPLSPNLMLSVFSDYNYSEGTRFNHERNDIVNFYKTFRSDTSTIMNNGYNPLVEEHTLGGALLWQGADSSKFRAGFSYAGLQNECALDIPVDTAGNRLHWALWDRSIIRLDAALLEKKVGPLRINFKTAFIGEDVAAEYKPDTSLANINGNGGVSTFIADADAALAFGLGVRLQGLALVAESFDSEKNRYTEYYPEIFYRKSLLPPNHPLGNMSVKMFIGVQIVPDQSGNNDSIFVSAPYYGASFEYRPTAMSRLTLYTKRDHFPTAGAEGQIETKYGGLLLGYQLAETDDRGYMWSQHYMWPQGVPPYAQPGNTFIVAPWTARFGGFSLLARAMIADEKPYLKTTAALSHLIIPRGMTHSFETELGFDYWSERDPVTFAEMDCWSDPILDVNLKVTAHIKSFRLFYKVGNLLNMRQAYVPGYFSPGLTFRWGINWFLM